MTDAQVREANEGVVCVIVTYADRFSYFSKVIDRVLSFGVSSVVLVCNGVSDGVAIRIEEHKAKSLYHTIKLEVNLGSAAGYRTGIEYAMKNFRPDYIWLLDDDNLPDTSALEVLLSLYRLERVGVVYASMREDRPQQKRAFKRCNNISYPKSAFLGHSVFDFIENSESSELIRADVAPYGGILFSADAISAIGLPNSEFYLYGDDYEYVLRLQRFNYKLYISKKSIIYDLEKSWHMQSRGAAIFSRSISEDKIYYTIRNGVYIDGRRANVALKYWINGLYFLIIQIAKEIKALKVGFLYVDRWCLLARAFRHGRAGTLGKIIKAADIRER